MANAQSVTLKDQLTYVRVKQAYDSHAATLLEKLKNANYSHSEIQVLLIALKHEQKLQVFLSSNQQTKFKLFCEYDFCVLSGTLGPKRKQGDLQVPEGFYYIDRFNPFSTFHLSLGINYPNASDKILSDKKNPGGDIFIHGNCVSVGCIPITDDKIKELYLLCVYAANNGQKNIPVYLFPCEMSSQKMQVIKSMFPNSQQVLNFWENLAEGYQLFQQRAKALKFHVDKSGKYIFD